MLIISLTDAIAITIAVTCTHLLRSWSKRSRGGKLPYPPGPKGLPIIGNILDMPKKNEWETARQWGEKYGPLVFVKNLGEPFLFLNSYEAIVDLFEKRGNIYSSRPRNTMLELEGFTEWFVAILPYGDELRKARQLLHRHLQINVVPEYQGIQESSIHRLLNRILESPDKFIRHIKQTAGESILMVAYGYKAAEEHDPYVAIVEKGMNAFIHAEGFFLVNLLPWLQYLPSWFPGAGFINVAKEGHKNGMDMYLRPYELAKRLIDEGNATPSISSKLLDSHRTDSGEIIDEALLAKVSGIIYGAGEDTTSSSLATFILAMVLYPEVLKRGQEEVERVVGKNTLPTFSDRANLPYVEAIRKECLRWQVVAPLAVAHTLTEDDEYNGYFIPAGTTVFSNLWAVLRDPNVYTDPEKFIPERWLPNEGKESPIDVDKIGFGIGRRICPGRHFAENSVFIGIASMLASFNFEKAIGEDGKSITPEVVYTTDFNRHPLPFKCSITPRNDEIVALVKQTVEMEI